MLHSHLNSVMLHRACSTYAIIFMGFLRGSTVHFAQIQHKYHAQDAAGKCMVQAAGHQLRTHHMLTEKSNLEITSSVLFGLS